MIKQRVQKLRGQVLSFAFFANLSSEIPHKQTRTPALTLNEYQSNYKVRNIAIKKAYESGGYTLKEIGLFFGLHYSRVSRIVAKGKT